MDWRALHDAMGPGYKPSVLLDVGAHVGEFSKSFVQAFPGCTPVLIEPNPHCAAALAGLPFESHSFAASDEAGEAELHLTSEWLQSTGASLYRENTHFFRDEVLQKVTVPRRRLDDVLAGRTFDVVKIDVQGAELDVLRGARALIARASFVLIEVSLVNYNAGGARPEDVFAELSSLGFDCAAALEFHRLASVAGGALLQIDFLFENRARKAARVVERGTDLVSFASDLREAGRPEIASALLRHMAGVSAPDAHAIEALAGQSLASGQLAEGLDLLLRLRRLSPGNPNVVAMLHRTLAPAVEQINRCFEKSEWSSAAAIACPLARLLPGYLPVQRIAMTVSANLADTKSAAEFAAAVLTLDASAADALRVQEIAHLVAQANADEVEPAREALFPTPGRHTLMTLRNLHDAATAVLCGEMDDAGHARVRAYLTEAQRLVVDVPDGTELEGWRKHFRLAFKAMDPDIRLELAIPPPPSAPPVFAATSGETLSRQAFLQRIAVNDPRAVFFVAADAKYVSLYANHYIASVAANCDVPYVIVLHVIGGAGRMADIAASLRIDGANVVLMADDFDAGAVTTKCFDTPPKGMYPHPAAHFQSARFQWLGWLLEAVDRPVFVSDIDLLLQRGVEDLLIREASNDLVLNENEASNSAGSRLTANLLLLNPTPIARYFAGALKAYLDRHLAEPEVSRWIDQFALVMVRHRLRRQRPDAKIGYFDTHSDINNLMYRTYEKNPFRFLSLYHGFDMGSLKSAA